MNGPNKLERFSLSNFSSLEGSNSSLLGPFLSYEENKVFKNVFENAKISSLVDETNWSGERKGVERKHIQ